MSQETIQDLNQNTLIGFTEQRGTAWHYSKSAQGKEPNHYPSAIPVDDVLRRLFYWEAVEGSISVAVLNEDGVLEVKDPRNKAIVRPDYPTEGEGLVLGYFRGQPGSDEGYNIHQYREWLLEKVAFLLDDDLSIGSAGLLKEGAQAWVQLEVPDSITTPSGVEFRPHLVAATSLDGSLATSYTRSVTVVVCDNTLAAAVRGKKAKEQQIKVRHSRYSKLKLQDARDALQLVHDTADVFSQEVEELTNTTVTDKQWADFLDSLAPLPEDEGRARTNALNKRDKLTGLYEFDQRVAPWKGTAFGVLQAVNTYEHHLATVKGTPRTERNATRKVTGAWEKLDQEVIGRLDKVLLPA